MKVLQPNICSHALTNVLVCIRITSITLGYFPVIILCSALKNENFQQPLKLFLQDDFFYSLIIANLYLFVSECICLQSTFEVHQNKCEVLFVSH